MRRALLLLPLLGGCPAPAALPPGGSSSLQGGVMPLPACGYALVTPRGVSAPVPGADALGPGPEPFAVHLGIAGDAARGIAVQWRTRDNTTPATRVRYGVGDRLDQEQRGATFYYDLLDLSGQPDGRTVRVHEVHLCGLQPGTSYSYRVGGVGADGREVFSPVYRFHTAPDPKAAPAAQVQVAVLGDTRGGYGRFAELLAVASAKAQGAPDLLLFSGDAVTYGSQQEEWDQFFAAGEGLLPAAPLLFAHGNHEENAPAYYAQFALPGDEQDYGVDYGPLHVTVLNDSPWEAGALAEKTTRFLAADLQRSAAWPWRVALHHRGLWSAALVHGGDAQLRALFGPLFDRHALDLVLSGHDHNYERTRPLRGVEVKASPRDGTVYVVAGSAGAVLYDNGADFFTERSERTESLLLLRLRAGRLEASAYRPDGTLLDTFGWDKPPPPPPPL